MIRNLCFLDMDGVLADFVGAICRAHGRADPYADPANFGNFDMDKIWGMSAADFWAPTNSLEFWQGMEPTAEASEIVKFALRAFGRDRVCILSAPSKTQFCVPGKRAWIDQHFPKLKNNVIFGSAKQFLSGPGRFLIDDRDRNLIAFARFGGVPLPVARPWNRHYSKPVLPYLKSTLEMETI